MTQRVCSPTVSCLSQIEKFDLDTEKAQKWILDVKSPQTCDLVSVGKIKYALAFVYCEVRTHLL